MNTNIKCKKCKHYQNGQCLILNSPREENQFCSNYTDSPYICELCGNHLISSQVLYEQGKQTPWHMICGNCFTAITTCKVCSYNNYCAFAQDASIKETPYTMQTIRQGNSIIQMQAKNPKRIELTCKKCKCFHNDSCLREEDSQCEN